MREMKRILSRWVEKEERSCARARFAPPSVAVQAELASLSAHSVRKATVEKMLCSVATESQSAFERPLTSFNIQKSL